jgi:hypothetical protein
LQTLEFAGQPDLSAMFGWLLFFRSPMRLAFIFYGLLFLAFSAHAEVQTPERTREAFYAWVLEHQSSALPSAEQRSSLSSLLSPQLIKLLEEASATEERCIKVTPAGDKPDVFEGDLFAGVYEGATEVSYGKVHTKGNRATAEVELVFIDTTFPKAHKFRALVWKSRLEMNRQGERWLIRDIRFGRKDSLVSQLREYLAQGKSDCRAAPP